MERHMANWFESRAVSAKACLRASMPVLLMLPHAAPNSKSARRIWLALLSWTDVDLDVQLTQLGASGQPCNHPLAQHGAKVAVRQQGAAAW